MKSGTLDMTKFKRLRRKLNESERGAAGLLECIWQRATKDCPRGDIGRFTNEEIAIMADWQGDPETLVDALVECGWFDPNDCHRLVIHDWHDHAPNWLRGVAARCGGFVTISGQPTVENQQSGTMVTQPSNTNTNSSQASPTPVLHPEAPEPEPLGDGWVAVAKELASEGIRKPEECCLQARSRGCIPSDAMKIIAYYREKKPTWGPTALYYRVFGLRPDEKVSIRWPKVEGVLLISREEFNQHREAKNFKARPRRHATEKNWVYATLLDGSKVECRDYPPSVAKQPTSISETQSC